jgi:cytochrome c oxidase subunit II
MHKHPIQYKIAPRSVGEDSLKPSINLHEVRTKDSTRRDLAGVRQYPVWNFLCAFLLIAGLLFLATPLQAAPRTSNLWWIPPVASAGGEKIDQLLYFVFYLTVGVFILTQVVYVYFLIKYRAKKGVKATYSHGNNRLEVVWTSTPAIIFIGLWAYGNHLWWNVLHTEPPANSMQVAVTAYQFAFSFQYPGPDGHLGRSDVKRIANDNMFGNDKSDPAFKNDFQSTTMVLPVNKPVRIRLNSKDVIHSFYVPEFRVYQDAVPGRTIDWVWFTPTKVGTYQLVCNQLCGQGHYNMKADIQVMSQEDFDKWYQSKTKGSAKASAKQDLLQKRSRNPLFASRAS